MLKNPSSRCLPRDHSARIQRRRRAAIDLALTTVLWLAAWIAGEWCSLRWEQRAKAILTRNYKAFVIADPVRAAKGDDIFGDDWSFNHQGLDLRELWRGRLDVPIRSISFYNTIVDDQAWKQVVCLRHLQSLRFQDCQVKYAVEFHLASRRCLKNLRFTNTRIKPEALCSIVQLCNLETLVLDGRGLTGKWLQYVSQLPKLREFHLNTGDLSDCSTDSLARMTALTNLQFDEVKMPANSGVAIGRLVDLECLAIADTHFCDEDMKHLASLRRLEDLFLIRTAITDAGVAVLEKLPNLRRLSLCNNNVSDAGLLHLCRLSRLEGLDIRATRTTNACLPTLTAIGSLGSVLVDGTRISSTSVGFVGVLRQETGIWYPNATKARTALGVH